MKKEEIVYHMLDNDAFSQWLGVQVCSIKEGTVVLEMKVREEMTNGHKIAHGGITYSLADSCLAFTVNYFGLQAMSIDTSISHFKPVFAGDTLRATSSIIRQGKKLAWVLVDIENQNNEKVAHFKGTTFKSDNEW